MYIYTHVLMNVTAKMVRMSDYPDGRKGCRDLPCIYKAAMHNNTMNNIFYKGCPEPACITRAPPPMAQVHGWIQMYNLLDTLVQVPLKHHLPHPNTIQDSVQTLIELCTRPDVDSSLPIMNHG